MKLNIDTDLKNTYWDISRELNLEDKFNPVNLNEEKQKFKESYRTGGIYNPIFDYNKLDNNKVIIKELKKLQFFFEKSKTITKELYIEKILFDISCVENFSNRSNEKKYSKWLTSLYGIPKKNLFDSAIEILKKTSRVKVVQGDLSPKKALNIFEKELSNRNFLEWKVALDNIPAKISINPLSRIITIKKDVLFSSREIKRLIAHEIDVHVLRNENGKLQEDKIFSYGFPNYLKTEEGLAITSEKKQGLLENNDLRRYCSRVIASYFSNKKSFSSLFHHIKENHSFEESFSIVLRIKRGLIDTSILGGYTKDQVYLAGYLELKEQNRSTLKNLYCGKIGLKDIGFANNEIEINTNYSIPDWVKKL